MAGQKSFARPATLAVITSIRIHLKRVIERKSFDIEWSPRHCSPATNWSIQNLQIDADARAEYLQRHRTLNFRSLEKSA